MMVAPAVIRTGTAGLQCPPEVGKRERGDLLIHAELHGGRKEGVERLAYLLEVVLLLPGLSAVSVEHTQATEKHLTADAQSGVQADHPSDFAKLISDVGARKRFCEADKRGCLRQDRIQC